MDRCERTGLLLRGSEGSEARMYVNPNSIVCSERKEKIRGNHFHELAWICEECGLNRHAFVKSYVVDETVGDGGPFFRSLRRLSCLFDYLLLDLMPGKTFLDLDDARGLEIDDHSCRLALFGCAIHPPIDGICVEHVYPRRNLAVLLGELLDRFVLEGEELLYVIEERRFVVSKEVASEGARVLFQGKNGDRGRRLLREQHVSNRFTIEVSSLLDVAEQGLLLILSAQRHHFGNAER